MNPQSKIIQRKGKHIQIFADTCSICEKHKLNVEIGKCASCKLDFFLLMKNLFSINEHDINIALLCNFLSQSIQLLNSLVEFWIMFFRYTHTNFPLTDIMF